MPHATTVVFQSYRTRDVPGWIAQCLTSVQQWARSRGHDYHFVGDEFLALVPDWYRAKAGAEICPVADLARLLLAKELLARGYELAIWIDADVLVFRPEAMALSLEHGFACAHEFWLTHDATGQAKVAHGVNNAVMMFARDSVQLPFLIDACLRIARAKPQLGKLDVGTHFLCGLRNLMPFPLVQCLATLSPAMLRALADRDGATIAAYAKALPRPSACANLCASLAHDATALHAQVVEQLLASRGAVLNRDRTQPTAHA